MCLLCIWFIYQYIFNAKWVKFAHLCFVSCFFALLELNGSSLGWVGYSYNFSWDYLSSLILVLVPLVFGLSVLSEGINFFLGKHNNSLIMSLGMLMFFLLGCFCCSSFLGFYMSFEASMIVMVFIILSWGTNCARYAAAGYMAAYAVLSSLPFLWCVVELHMNNGHSSMLMSLELPHLSSWGSSLFGLSLCLTFLVKSPLYPFHLWLPKAHVEAPTCASMILAGVMLKLGTYGLFRVGELFLDKLYFLTPYVVAMGVWGSVMSSLICLRLVDLKEIVAYASVGHMGLVCGSIFVGSNWGLSGALCMLVSHGLISSLLFATVGFMSSKTSSRSVLLNKGFMKLYPTLSLFVFFACACNMSAPPFISFLAEVGIIGSLGAYHWVNFILLSVSSFLTGVYSLKFYLMTQHGPAHPNMRPSSVCWDGPAYLSMALHTMFILSMSLVPYLFVF